MKYLFRVSLQVKILCLILSLILLIISIMTIAFTIMEYRDEISNAENSALQSARTLSYIPRIQDAVHSTIDNEVKFIFDRVTKESGATNIILETKDGLFYSHTSNQIKDELMNRNLSYQAFIFGNAYVRDASIDDEAYLFGIAPISINYANYNRIEGVIFVAFDKDEIIKSTLSNIRSILFTSLLVLVVGVIGSIMLTKSIRRDTLGLEPIEIASLYKQRDGILQSIKEGIIAIDSTFHIAMMNNSAKQILDIKGKIKGKPLVDLFGNSTITDIIMSPNQMNNIEMNYNAKTIIVNTTPILEEKSRIGTVISFRDKTEIKNMINTISEVKKYSGELRAQTHEFANKLYVLLGLLQLEKYEEAMSFIQEITEIQEVNSDVIFNHIKDEKIQAIILGKLAKASENKLEFIIDSNSSLEKLPNRIELAPLLIIIGNLIDNAFEAITDITKGKVTFFTTDIGKDIIFEITDNGIGIEDEILSVLYEIGTSEKGTNRGYGLANVKQELDQLGGFIEIETSKKGTRFSVFLPKR